MDERPPIEQTLKIDAELDRVWKAITTAEDLMRWFPMKADVTPGEGGKIWMSWGEGMEGTEKIEIWEPPRHLRTSWSSPHGPLTVDYYLESEGGQTKLRLVHSGFGRGSEWDEEYDGIRKGWAFELRSLRHYLENYDGQERTARWESVPIEIDPDEAWDRITGKGGLIPAVSSSRLSEGDEVRITTSTGETLSGVVFVNPPRNEISLLLDEPGGTLVRFGVESCFGTIAAYTSIGSYTMSIDRVSDWIERWKAELQKLLAPAGTPAS